MKMRANWNSRSNRHVVACVDAHPGRLWSVNQPGFSERSAPDSFAATAGVAGVSPQAMFRPSKSTTPSDVRPSEFVRRW